MQILGLVQDLGLVQAVGRQRPAVCGHEGVCLNPFPTRSLSYSVPFLPTPGGGGGGPVAQNNKYHIIHKIVVGRGLLLYSRFVNMNRRGATQVQSDVVHDQVHERERYSELWWKVAIRTRYRARPKKHAVTLACSINHSLLLAGCLWWGYGIRYM